MTIDIPFTTFAFKATGATTARTMPDRLADVHNVKDFGAVGDNSHDDTSAIQAAVDWTSGAYRGTIYFPPGSYKTTSAITYNYNGDLSIRFLGEIGARILGNSSTFLFDRSLGTPNNTKGGRIFERLVMENSNASGGCIRMGSTIGGAVRDCILSSHTNITTEDSAGNSSKNILIENCQFSLGAGTESGSNHIIIGGGGVIQNCSITGGADVAVRAYGSGLHCAGNRWERNNTAWLLGKDSAGTAAGLSGFSIMSSTFEGNWIAFDLAGPCDGFFIGSHLIQGHDYTNAGVQTPSASGSQYGIRIAADCATNGVIADCDINNFMDNAAVSIANATSRTNLLISCVDARQSGGSGVGWILPTNAYTATFQNCNTASVWTYSQLPTSTNILEGDEFDISDSTTATWGANVTTGGGSNRVRVRHNGTNWTVVGK